MDPEQIRKREAYFNGHLAPTTPFKQANLIPLIKAMDAFTAETVARIMREDYPRIEELD